ncbi:ABC transporter substrate-binding protein [Cohnella herbarum]|nr:ABC transporter substrate-binding protein [Cohnella herbarum]
MHNSAEKYLMLLNKWGINAESRAEIEVSADEVASALFCTPRNAKIIIRKLVDEGLISWHPGRGRGNVSRLAFLGDKNELLMNWAQEMARKGEYKQAFELLRSNSDGTMATDRFVHWLNDHFGYQAEHTNGNHSADTLRFPVYMPLLTTDPSRVYCAFDSHVIRQVFDRLVEYDHYTGNILPGLAHAWESNLEATEWTFHLRKGIRFHHGRELRPEDVKFTLERVRDDTPQKWLTRELLRVDCISPRSVRIVLNRPNHIFLRYVGTAGLSILPQELVQADEAAFWHKPIGTGPFRFIQWTQDCCELAANPDYYSGRAHLDRVIIAFMPEETAKLSKGAHWQQLVHNQNQMDQSESDSDRWNKLESLCRGCMMISWNMKKQGPQQAYGFRRAFELMLNRKQLIEDLGEERMYPARGFRPTELTPHMEEESDADEAKRLLAESGYVGEEIILCTYGSNETDARWIERRCAEFGINLKVQTETYFTVRKPRVVPNVDGILFNVIFAVDEVCEIENYEQSGNFLREHLHPRMHQWILEQIDLSLASRDPQFRRRVLDGIEDRLREESHVCFLLHKKQSTFSHPSVKGVGLNSLGWMDFKEIWLQNAQ